jgi:hypothetical protein
LLQVGFENLKVDLAVCRVGWVGHGLNHKPSGLAVQPNPAALGTTKAVAFISA